MCAQWRTREAQRRPRATAEHRQGPVEDGGELPVGKSFADEPWTASLRSKPEDSKWEGLSETQDHNPRSARENWHKPGTTFYLRPSSWTTAGVLLFARIPRKILRPSIQGSRLASSEKGRHGVVRRPRRDQLAWGGWTPTLLGGYAESGSHECGLKSRRDVIESGSWAYAVDDTSTDSDTACRDTGDCGHGRDNRHRDSYRPPQ